MNLQTMVWNWNPGNGERSLVRIDSSIAPRPAASLQFGQQGFQITRINMPDFKQCTLRFFVAGLYSLFAEQYECPLGLYLFR